jgi:hypothetical protein
MARDVREIGPIGTVGRAAGGLGLLGIAAALGSVAWPDVAVGLIAFPLLATLAARLISEAYERFAPAAPARRHAICSGPGCSLIAILLAVTVGLDVLTSVDGDAAFAVWLGASMLVAAARGYGGCEMLAFPNALTGRRERIGCILYTPLDAAEARYRTRRQASTPC